MFGRDSFPAGKYLKPYQGLKQITIIFDYRAGEPENT